MEELGVGCAYRPSQGGLWLEIELMEMQCPASLSASCSHQKDIVINKTWSIWTNFEFFLQGYCFYCLKWIPRATSQPHSGKGNDTCFSWFWWMFVYLGSFSENSKWSIFDFLLTQALSSFPENSDIETLTPGVTVFGARALEEGKSFNEVIGWDPTLMGLPLWRRVRATPALSLSLSCEDLSWNQEEVLTRYPSCQYPNLRLQVSRTVRKQMSFAEATQSVGLCSGSPSRLRDYNTGEQRPLSSVLTALWEFAAIKVSGGRVECLSGP